MNHTETLSTILKHKAVAVIRLHDAIDTVHALLAIEAILRGGVKIVEITLTTPKALDLVHTVRQQHSDAMVGVGSVLNRDEASAAISAGAQFVVSPVMKPEIVDACRAGSIVSIIGAFTPTEILTAHEVGADIVKIFPADTLGMGYIKSITAPMPHLRVMPTGGVSLTNAGEWLLAGACAVGIGSALCDTTLVTTGNFTQLTENARMVVKAIHASTYG
jgi:2-dehydro-3-deoxyphosphogluconate aldolase/(4S)-4-hydroxy-2-oxoglutarate aldolase